ncbi:RHS repeat protein [Paenibacillus oralis]|uniref:RHS repeat protein n=1 Tax=Paenibacillus oralis TaxID=2490856 RepID=A0A3P3U9M2_9BACL|nr:RHS repeat-associated core domain-containing protein [Paenibacillus oralis]RRJ67000.1 RHS repeat protein [Paenibacillus oralis]
MKKWISLLLSIVLVVDLVFLNGGYVSAEESAALPDSVESDISTVTSSVYDELLDKLSDSLDPDEIITISTVVDRFGVDRSWVASELVKGYKLSDIFQALLFQEEGGEYQAYLDRLYPNMKPDPLTAFNQQSATDAVYRVTVTESVYPETVTEDTYGFFKTLAATSKYDELALQRAPLKIDQAPYSVGSVNDSISTVDGSLSIRSTDLFIKGANGLDFALTRMYDSSLSKDRIYVSSRDKNITGVPTEEKRFGLGKGWIWDIPYMKTESGIQYVYIPGIGTYALDGAKLEGYPWRSPQVGRVGEKTAEKLDDLFGVSDAAYQLVDYTGGTSCYFDSRGYPLLITNRYGNYIEFSWNSDGLRRVITYPGAGQLGNFISLSYSSGKITATSYDSNTGEQQTVQYIKGTVEANNRNQEILKQVIDPAGRVTTYNYNILSGTLFNLIRGYENYQGSNRRLNWGWNDWVLLTSIEHPTKAITQYSLDDVVLRRMGQYAAEEEPRYGSRIVSYSTQTETISKAMTISYTGDVGETYGKNFTFSVAVNDGLTETAYSYKKVFIGNRVPDILYLNTVDSRSLDGTLRNVTSYTYDEANRRAVPIATSQRSYTGSSGSSAITTRTQYDEWGLVTAATDPFGVTSTYTYTLKPANTVQQWVPEMVNVPVSASNTLTTNHTYDPNTATLTQSAVVDSSGKLWGQTNYGYDTFGNPTSIRLRGDQADTVLTQEFGYRSILPSSQTVTVTDASGTAVPITVRADYNQRGDITRYVDGNGNGTTSQYDGVGRIIQETYADGSSIRAAYDDAYNKITVTQPNGSQITYEYDPFGRLVKETDARGSSTYLYDEFDRMIAKTDAEGQTTRYTYDAYGRALTENDGTSTTTYIYNDAARSKTTIDGEGNQIRETYDIAGRAIRTEEIRSSGSVVLSSNEYNNYGHLLSTTDANGNKTTYTYDALSQLIAVTDAEGKTTSYSYNMAGDMFKLTYADGKSLTKSYDEIGRLLKRTDPLGQVETYSYDNNGNVIRHIDRKGQTHTYQYNNRDLLIQDQASDETITYTYDSMGNRLTMTDGTGASVYAYAPTGELTSLTYPDGASLTMDYDRRGARTSQTFTLGSYQLSSKTTYQGASALPQQLQVLNSGGTEISTVAYTYRKNNSLAQTTTATGLTKTYTYTGLNLTGLQTTQNGATLKQYTYGYDNNRNITSQNDNGTGYTYGYDALNRIKTSSQFNELYAYDQRDNRSSLTTDRTPEIPTTASYQYDAKNRLKGATVDGMSITYSYNGDDLMVGRTKDGQTIKYYYDDRGLLVAEGTVNSRTVAITYGYVFDATGKLVSRQGANESGLQYYVTNGHGDVTELRDASGNLLNSYSYDIWGNPLTVQETVPNALRYAGEYWDADTKLQYLRARWYDPATARFIGEDTYEGSLINPMSLNLYTYVENNPLIYADPTGNWCTATVNGKYYSHPGKCSGSGSGQYYIPDDNATNFGRTIIDAGKAKGKWYPEGAVYIKGDPTGISDAFIGCAYDSQCLGFVGGAVSEVPAAYNGVKTGVSNGVKLVKGLIGSKKDKGNVNLLTRYSNFNDLAKNTNPKDLIRNLENQGWNKVVEPGGRKSGPATIFTDPSTGNKIRIHANPGEGTPYFRVQNKGGNYLDQSGNFPSNASRQELRELTHFYFGK